MSRPHVPDVIIEDAVDALPFYFRPLWSRRLGVWMLRRFLR